MNGIEHSVTHLATCDCQTSSKNLNYFWKFNYSKIPVIKTPIIRINKYPDSQQKIKIQRKEERKYLLIYEEYVSVHKIIISLKFLSKLPLKFVWN